MSEFKVRYFVTKNRRAPWLILYGEWPTRSGFRKMALAGCHIATRNATQEEIDYCNAQVRYIAQKWPSLFSLVQYEAATLGIEWSRSLMLSIRKNIDSIRPLLTVGEAKAKKHQDKLSRNRLPPKPAKSRAKQVVNATPMLEGFE